MHQTWPSSFAKPHYLTVLKLSNHGVGQPLDLGVQVLDFYFQPDDLGMASSDNEGLLQETVEPSHAGVCIIPTAQSTCTEVNDYRRRRGMSLSVEMLT